MGTLSNSDKQKPDKLPGKSASLRMSRGETAKTAWLVENGFHPDTTGVLVAGINHLFANARRTKNLSTVLTKREIDKYCPPKQ